MMTEKRKRQLRARYLKARALVHTAMSDRDCGVSMLLYMYPGLERAFREMESVQTEVRQAIEEEKEKWFTAQK